MKITILYFASLADTLDCAEEEIEFDDEHISVAALKQQLSQRSKQWQQSLTDQSTACAVNQTIANDNTVITNNAEVAFFPPVTGG